MIMISTNSLALLLVLSLFLTGLGLGSSISFGSPASHRPTQRLPYHGFVPAPATALVQPSSSAAPIRPRHQSWCCSPAFAKTSLAEEEAIHPKESDFVSSRRTVTTNDNNYEKRDWVEEQDDDSSQKLQQLLAFVDSLLSNEKHGNNATESVHDILQRIDRMAMADLKTAQESCLELEQLPHQHEEPTNESVLPPYEWIYASAPASHNPSPRNYPLAVRSTGETPLLNAQAVADIRRAAEYIWTTSSSSSSSSRFTYQYPGNSEAHVFDFAALPIASGGTQAVEALNAALQHKIYPLIRQVFLPHLENDCDSTQLFVYDALVIRYNGTAAAGATDTETGVAASMAAPAPAAGQPLHRDLGLVSVNIMLNSPDAFDGGGTFFENQLQHFSSSNNDNSALDKVDQDGTIQPLQPRGVGHGLFHAASERHAGAGTTRGVRDILVLFVAAHPSTVLQTARLKQSREHCCQCAYPNDPLAALLCRIQNQCLAVQVSQGRDGEAFQYLGTALMEYADLVWQTSGCNDQNNQGNYDCEFCDSCWYAALQCYQRAAVLTPCDARVYNNQAIVLGKLHQHMLSSSLETSAPQQQQREQAYRRGMDLLRQSQRAGCNVMQDYDLLSLNYGLFLANQDCFAEASHILEQIAGHESFANKAQGPSTTTTTRINAHRLWKWCQEQLL